jgi:hypothetical protein
VFQIVLNFPSPPDYAADLQEVWSVRKNIHHTSGARQPNISSSISSSAVLLGTHAKSNLYSRHGAIPAHQSQPAPGKGGKGMLYGCSFDLAFIACASVYGNKFISCSFMVFGCLVHGRSPDNNNSDWMD